MDKGKTFGSSRFSGEGWDRKSVIDPNNKALWDYEREMTEKSAELFKDGDFCLSVKEKEMIDTVKARLLRRKGKDQKSDRIIYG